MEKRTFKQLQEADGVIASLYKKNPLLKDSKFGYAWKRFTEKNYAPIVRDFNEELANIRIDNALEDPNTKELLTDRTNPRGFKYSKEGMKAVMVAERALEDKFNNMEVDVKAYLAPTIPDEVKALEDDQRELLQGLVL